MAKGSGKHPEKALTAMQVRNLKEAGRYADGNGLYLKVEPSGSKRWVLRTVVHGRRRDIGLGSASLVPLAEAREKALQFRKLAREGGDPIAERRLTSVTIPTFAEAAASVHEQHKGAWKNGKHQQQWINTLRDYAFPVIGNKRVDQIATPDILQVLAPIWLVKPETASRVRQRMGAVFEWAKTAGHRSGDNPVAGVAKGLPKQKGGDRHHQAMPFAQVPSFVQRLRNAATDDELTRLALEFLILTASRTSEVLDARWTEIDEGAKLWTISAERMKAGRVHRIPLTDRCIEILARAKELKPNQPFIFPGEDRKTNAPKPKSNMVFSKLLGRMNVDVTTHGFRSSFCDWAAETTHHSREVSEMALAHTLENKVEAAYRRGDLLEKRAALMRDWAEFLDPEINTLPHRP